MSAAVRQSPLAAEAEGAPVQQGGLPEGVPPLDEVSGAWQDAAELAHLPSLRNQIGQGHVNHDLASLSWLAAPPFSFGYHTGVLTVDGAALPAQRFRWRPWGVLREHVRPGLTVRTDTRMGLAEDLLLWQVELVNTGAEPVEHTVAQELFAPVAHTETGWGWLYDVPWSAGNHHDFMTLERVRAATHAGHTGDPYLLGRGPRVMRLGRPRLPGIQRDADTGVMDLSFELPRHVSTDTVYPHRSAAPVTLRALRATDPDGTARLAYDGPVRLASDDTEIALDAYELTAGQRVRLELRAEAAGGTGVVLTHGNQPDSLQLGLAEGLLWFGIGGEEERADAPALEPGRWYAVECVLGADRAELLLDGVPVAATRHWTRSRRWTARSDGRRLHVVDGRSPARASYAFATAPDVLTAQGPGGRAEWRVRLEPGQRRRIGVVCAYATDAAEAAGAAAYAAATLTDRLAAGEAGHRTLWQAAFTPGNGHFSGHFPVLRTEDEGLARSYYMGALLALYLRNTRAGRTEPVFLTGGPRLGPTTTYFWDHTEWSRLYALLEPKGLRAWLLRALSGPYQDSFGFDTRGGGPLGNTYTSNHYALFRLAEHYVGATGDLAFLDETAGDRTVFAHLDRLAHGWRELRTEATGGQLADFGPDPWRLLECVPGYVHAVASFNAAYVGMTRAFGSLLRLRGEPERAAEADREADELAAATVALARPDGRWEIRHPDRTESIGHVLDFGLTASYLHADLSAGQRAAMVSFAWEKLVASTWMRALAPDDPAAPTGNRPDHGAAGAFCAWPGVTAHGLAKLGRPDLAQELLGRLHASASGGLWGQAQEIVVGPDGRDRSVRVAEDGVSNRDSIGGVGTAEAVLSGLFGFEPGFRELAAGEPLPTELTVPGVGTLSGLNVRD